MSMKSKLLCWLAGAVVLACLFPAAGLAEGTKPKSREFFETRGEIVWEVPIEEKWIALTFDDGPDPVYTPQIAALLKQYGARATFFVTGDRASRYPETVRMLAEAGHELGNHTFRHIYFRSGTSERVIDEEIRKAKEAIEATGISGRALWFRPPGGYYSEKIVEIAKRYGYTVVLWSWHQDTKDWRRPGVDKIAGKVLRNARNGDIVLLHDHGDGAGQTTEALKRILPELQARGYRFVTVSELVAKRKRPAADEAGKPSSVTDATARPRKSSKRSNAAFHSPYSVVIDPLRNRLTVYRDGQKYKQYPIALGKPETPTPVGDWRIVNKYKNWGSGFGTRWLGLNVPWGTFGIHGTNRPHSIGQDASHGCVRMLNAHVEELYNYLPIGTPVTILGHPLGEPHQSPRDLAKGDSGADVMLIQSRLRSAGYFKGACTGKFDGKTEYALRKFEQDNRLPVDGVMNAHDYVAMGLVD